MLVIYKELNMSKLKALWKKIVEFFTGKRGEVQEPVFEEPVFGPTTPETAQPPEVIVGPTDSVPTQPVETVGPTPVFGPTTPVPTQPVEDLPQPVFGPTSDVTMPTTKAAKTPRKPRAKQAEAKVTKAKPAKAKPAKAKPAKAKPAPCKRK